MMETQIVAENLAHIEARIRNAERAALRSEHSVRLLAVSKKQPLERIQAAVAAGQKWFGENYVQELAEKRSKILGVSWHLIGHLQSNKSKQAVECADVIETVDSLALAKRLDAAATAQKKRLPILIEVRLGDEPSKAGVDPLGVEALIGDVRTLPSLELIGLMTIPAAEDARRHFATLRELRDDLSKKTGLLLPELSMGMSSDFEDAIAEGSTIVRIGTAIFGERSRL